jgi:hypothetical protein
MYLAKKLARQTQSKCGDNHAADGDFLAADVSLLAADGVPLAADSVPPAADSVPPAADSVPPAAEDVPPAADSVPPAAKNVPPAAKDAPPAAKNVPPAAKDVPPAAGGASPEEPDRGTPATPSGRKSPKPAEDKKSTTPFISQIIEILHRPKFAELVKNRGTESKSKGFSSWDHFIVMLFAQLSNANSLREIVGMIASHPKRAKQLDLKSIPSINTLSYANKHRDWRLFQDFFDVVMAKINRLLIGYDNNILKGLPLYSLDSSVISLCMKTFDWALYRRSKGGIKLHTLLDHQYYLPCYMLITEAKKADVKAAQQISGDGETEKPLYIDYAESRSLVMPKGSIIVMDRGYNDYCLFYKWTQEGIFFVTRPKTTMSYEVTKALPLPAGDKGTFKKKI